MGDHMDGSWGGRWNDSQGIGWARPVLMVIFLMILIAAAALLLLLLRDKKAAAAAKGTGNDSAVTLIRERYARGEIDEAEFQTRRALLSAPPQPPA
jgi:putative membrane protein